MNKPLALISLFVFSLLSGCGPAGKLSGKVVVEGGQAGNILVRILGPSSKGVVTDSSGNFAAEGLADGTYQVIAEVEATDVTSQSDTVKVANGTADKSPTLTFKASVGQIAGKVAFNDMADPSGVPVTLIGTETRGAITDSGGAFSFTGLKAGAYSVTAEVAGTREGRISVAVTASATAMPLPDMVFTNLGTLTGNVKAGTANAPNAAVNIPGTELFALTDANGDFTIRNVPTGMRTVQARLNSAISTQTVAVVKGDNTPLAFTLQTALTGTVEGSIGFAGSNIDTAISVSAAGTTFTATAGANGEYRLTLPPGAWEIVADARNYPRKSLGVHFVAPGAVTRVPTAKMTLARRLPFPAALSAFSSPIVCEGDIVLQQLNVGTANQLHVVDTNLLNRRLIASPLFGSVSNVALSSKCKWVAFSIGINTFVHNVTTGEQRLVSTTTATYGDFATDESVYFYRVGTTFHRYNLTSGVDDSFTANQLVTVTRDRHLVAGPGAPANWQLVTPTTLTSAFSTASTVSTFGGAAFGLTDCTAIVPITCTLRTLGTTGTTINTYSTGSVPNTTVVDSTNSNGEYFHFRLAGTASILVRTSNGVGINMPASTQIIRYNPSNTRMAYVAPAATQALREEALPGSGSSAPVATSTGTFQTDFRYVSDTRLIAFDSGTPRRIDVKSGTAAIDSDVTTNANGPAMVAGSVATWGKATTSKRMALLGDGADVLIDAPANIFTGVADSVAPYNLATPSTGYVVPKYGALNTDVNTVFIIDAVKNELRKLNTFFVSSGTAGNVFNFARIATFEVGYFVPAFDQFLQVNEPGFGSVGVTVQPTIANMWLLTDNASPNDLLVVRLTPQ